MTEKQIQEFLDRLQGPEGCNFREDGRYICAHTTSRSTNILAKMGISQDEMDNFLAEAQEHGGFCDCEIIFNAADHL